MVSSRFLCVIRDSKSEDEVGRYALEATAGTITQKPYATRTFPRGLFEMERWRLSGVHAKLRLLFSNPRIKLGEKERELLNHDLENVERALGNVLERVSEKQVFYMERWVRIRAVPKPPSDDEDTKRPRKKSNNSPPM
ncbi:hypothetical protein Tco_0204709 [Tanacetum coccineum]